jgi:hypothetical protein
MMKSASATLAVVSIGTCLVLPVLFFLGHLARPAFETGFLIATVGWFVGAVVWVSRSDADDLLAAD